MTWWQYLLLVNLYLLLFYGFYALLLSRETFFQLNRIYLVAAALLSFFIPMIQADWVHNLFITQQVQYTIYSSPVFAYTFKPAADTHITVGQVAALVYGIGICFLLCRFGWQLLSLRRIISRQQSEASYSFFKKIKLGSDIENHDIICAHENVHARQWHSADVLLMEAVMIINWFNPVVYLYRFGIKHIHEYIADRQAVRSGTGKAEYAMLLLSQTFDTPTHQLVNPFFNKSLLKQRIMMLQKDRSRRVALFKYFLSAPLFMLMLILSSATVSNSKTIITINQKVNSVLLKPAQVLTNITINPDSAPAKVQKLTIAYQAAQAPAAARRNMIQVIIDTPRKNSKVFTAVEKYPEFPGGLDAFYHFLAKNTRYPAEARNKGIQGRVIIRFIVETNGALSNIKVVRGVDPSIDNEALRVLELSPKWIPGTQNGRAVRTLYTVPISFTLAQDDKQPEHSPAKDKSGKPTTARGAQVVSFVGDKQPADTGKQVTNLTTPGKKGEPLVIIDGKQTEGMAAIRNLNPKDIESISVLKDQTATLKYGKTGENGVVIVKTKTYSSLKLKPAAGN